VSKKYTSFHFLPHFYFIIQEENFFVKFFEKISSIILV